MPLVVVKQSDQAKASDAALADDSELVIALAAGTVYWITIYLRWNGGTTPDVKYALAYSGAFTKLDLLDIRQNSETAVTDVEGPLDGSVYDETNFTTVRNTTSFTGANQGGCVLRGFLTTNTAGNFSVQWAQNASNVTASTMFAGSAIIAIEQADLEEDVILKTGNTARLNTTVLADDPDLVYQLKANRKYIVHCLIVTYNHTTPGMKTAMNVTGSPTRVTGKATRRQTAARIPATVNPLMVHMWGQHFTTPVVAVLGGSTTSTNRGITEYLFSIEMAGNDGQVAFQFAQNVSDGTFPVTVYAGSFMRVSEVS